MALTSDDLRRQLRRVSSSFGPAQLVALALLGVITVFAVLGFYRWASAPSYSVLFSGLEASDISDVVQELDAQGVPHKLGGNGTTILVPSDQVHEVRIELSGKGLPAGGTVGFELFDKQGITTSEFRQRVDYQRALEGELTRTLLAVRGVSAANVHLAIPEERLFSDDQQPVQASVLLKTTGTLGSEAVQSIVHLVASAVPGLDPDGVTVADVNGQVLSAPGNLSGGSTQQFEMQQAYESQLAAQATSMLSQVFGPGHAVVRVSAQLNFDESQRESETFDPTNATPIRQQTETETFTGNGTAPAGVIGVDGQPIGEGTGETSYERSSTSTEMGIDRVVETSKVAPGRVERLSVAVVLDAAADPVPDPQRVQAVVAAALGVDPERGDAIVVDQLEFDQTLVEAADKAASAAASAASTDQLLSYARTGIGAIVLIVVAFFLIRGSRRTETPVELEESTLTRALAAAGQPAGELTTGGLPSAAAVAAAGGASVPQAIGRPAPGSYDDQVLTLIDQQPEEVAQLLRGWLADRRG